MQDLYGKDKYLFLSVAGMTGLALVTVFMIIGFIWSGVSIPASSIPSYDKATIQAIKDSLSARSDVDTDGKPDVTKYSFGKSEPF